MSEASFFPSPAGLRFSLRIFFAVFALVLCGELLHAQTPEDAVRGLARRSAEVREIPQAVAVEWSNTSSLPEAESILLREVFLKEFSGRHAVVTEPAAPGAATSFVLRVSVREMPTAFLILAQIPAATGVQVRMVELARTAFLPVMTRGSGLRLTRQLLWQQGETVLDAQEFAMRGPSGGVAGAAPGATNIFLLQPDAVVIYREDEERLTELQELAFTGYHYVSRGLRGEIVKDKDGNIAIVLPGLRCALRGPSAAAERWTMTCAANVEAATNAASGNAEKGGAATRKLGNTANAGLTVAVNNEGASDVQSVALVAGCQPGSWRLMSEATDWTQPDRLLLVNAMMKRDEAVAAVDFSGPVERLTAPEDGKSALAVVFDLASGSYDVYRVSMLCGR